MKLLLLSNSTNSGEAYLGWTEPFIKSFLEKNQIKKVLFFPFAGVNLSDKSLTKSYDLYEEKVAAVFQGWGVEITSVHHASDPISVLHSAECIAVGGGNTFHLVAELHRLGLMEAIRDRALVGVPFMGWSAGSNVACPTLRTTNDMPIIQPASFDCLNLIPFQINPHYLDANPAGHGGETRQQRIEEFQAINRDIVVVGLREASLISVDGSEARLEGYKPMRVFEYGKNPVELKPGSDLSHLL
jgi:dipeptidase E